MKQSAALTAVLSQLTHSDPADIDLSLGRIARYLEAAGTPQAHIPPVVHVAGTNGKGSTIAFLRALCEAQGQRCHIFTSPHLIRFNERIIVDGDEISDEALIPLVEAIIARQAAYPLTFFEANTAAAFAAFAAYPADVTLLEVGMGGRFDATNVINRPAVSIITPVSMDHAEYLGDTIAKIAYEKAGILKPGVPAVIAPQAPEAMAVIARVAAETGTPLYPVSEADVAALQATVSQLSLPGAHQWVNAAAAVKAWELLAKATDSTAADENWQQALASARWPARLQPITGGPLRDALPAHVSVWLDGGHNPAAGEALADWLGGQPAPAVICGMTKHKDAAAFLKPLAEVSRLLYAVPIEAEPEAMPVDRLVAAAAAAGITVRPCASLLSVVEAAATAGARTILIGGSLYLAGRVLASEV